MQKKTSYKNVLKRVIGLSQYIFFGASNFSIALTAPLNQLFMIYKCIVAMVAVSEREI